MYFNPSPGKFAPCDISGPGGERGFETNDKGAWGGQIISGSYYVRVYHKGGPQTPIGGGFSVGPSYWYDGKPCAQAATVKLEGQPMVFNFNVP